MEQQVDQTPLPLRSHTILGVCEAIGEDFGFNPTWLRVPLAASVLFSPEMAVGTYVVLGVVVLLSRLLFPRPKIAADTVEAAKPAPSASNTSEPELSLAA